LVFIDDAEACKRRMNAASALIGGLGGEKERWTQQSKMFEAQLTKYVKCNILKVTVFNNVCVGWLVMCCLLQDFCHTLVRLIKNLELYCLKLGRKS